MSATCGHPLCELVGGACSLATHRSRGCRPNLTTREIAPEVFDEVRQLLGAIDLEHPDEPGRAAARRLAAIVRREAMDDRPLLAHLRVEDPELAPALERLCARR